MGLFDDRIPIEGWEKDWLMYSGQWQEDPNNLGYLIPKSSGSVTPPERRDYGSAIDRGMQEWLASRDAARGAGDRQTRLADMLEAQATGREPSLAEALLKLQTDRNIKGAAGMLASQRGISPAMAQRLAVQEQGTLNQAAAQQGAALRLQEQLAARQMLGAALASQRGQDIAGQNAALGMYGTGAGANQAQNALNVQAQAANAQIESENADRVLAQRRIDAGLSESGDRRQGALAGAAGALGAALLAAGGGEVPAYARGGTACAAPRDFRRGGPVPGKARIKGDSYRNDTVPARLSPGEIVLPRSVTRRPDAEWAAKDFVEAVRRRARLRRMGMGGMAAHLFAPKAAIR